MKKKIVTLFFLSFISLNGFSQGICIDSTFGNNGIIYQDTGTCGALRITAEQNILASGRIINAGTSTYYLYKYSSDGSLDSNFGTNGCFHPPFGGISPIWLQDDGKILLAGAADTGDSFDFMALRLNQNGSLDNSFGESGIVVSNLAHYWKGVWLSRPPDGAYSLAQQTTKKVIVFGESNSEIALARYTNNGIIDSTFGQYGVVIQDIGLYGDEPNDLAVLPDDRFICGFRASINGQGAMCAMRFLPDGAIDSSFNQTGYAYYSDGWLTYCNAMCLQPDGKVLLAGYADSALIVRFDTSGALDPTFGTGGVCKLPPAAIRDMALAPDGKILVTGTKDSSFVVYRCLPNGALDTAFGNHGMILTKIETGEEDRAECIVLQADGKILVGGGSLFPGTHTPVFVLVRYLPDGHAPISGEEGLLQIYPNPVKDNILYIRWLGEQSQIVNIRLYDISGRILLKKENQKISNQPFDFDVSAFASGVYFVQIRSNNGLNEEHKFVKK